MSYLNHRFQAGARAYPGHTGSPLDEPAKTLKAGVHGVPGGENMLSDAEGHVRYFTVRESARLQTFPDDFVFHGAWSEAMRQLGNAVPVNLAVVLALEVRAKLATNGEAEPYSVLLLYPDYANHSGNETYYAFVTASDPLDAVAKAQQKAAAAQEGIDIQPDDFAPLLVTEGHNYGQPLFNK